MERARPLPLIVLLVLALASPASGQTLAPVVPAEYGKWESLGAATLSPDGRWLAYALNRVNEENELRVRGGARDTTLVFPLASGPAFTPDSRWIAYAIAPSAAERERLERERRPVRNKAALRNLTSGEAHAFEEIQSFRFSADGRFLMLRGYSEEGSRSASLVIRDLARGTAVSFGNVAEQAWSGRGAWIAMAMETESGAGNGVQLYDAATGTLRLLDSSAEKYRGLTWRGESDELAVLRAKPEAGFADTTHVALAWRRVDTARPELRTLDPSNTAGFPPSMRISQDRALEWAEDGSALYLGLRPRQPSRSDPAAAVNDAPANGAGTDAGGAGAQGSRAARADSVAPSDVQVWHAGDVRIMPMQKVQEQQDLRRTLLAVWHFEPARVVQVGTDLHETARVLGGGRWATETDQKPYAFGAKFGRRSSDVWLVDLRSGERRKVLEDVRQFYGGSATGAKLLWFDEGHYWSYDVASGRRTNLTEKVQADFRNQNHDYPVDQLPPVGMAGWAEDDAAVLVHDEYDVWSLAPDGSGGRRLTDGAAERIVHRYVRVGSDDDGIDLSRPVLVSLAGELSKRSGWARLRPGSAPERLRFEDARLTRLAKADSADVFAFTIERFDDSPDWFVGGAALADARRVSETNPFQADRAWGRAELIDFRSAAGLDLQGVLLYPAGFDPSRRYPMIVYTYERLSQNLHQYVVPSERSYYNLNVFTANGYFVLMPDIVYRGRDPGVSALEAVEPAVKAVVDRGLVDPARVGLVGHSWGGYQATYLPTRTNIFAASVAGAPITNFLSFAGAIHWSGGNPEFDHWETGQARMGVPPWEDFEAYLRNSPIHQVHQLRTPMLMMFGDADGTVDWHQGVEFYNHARRAGRDDFVMLVYPGEDHSLRKRENQVDYHRRILQWFGHYLKGDAAPDWITRGVTWLERRDLIGAR
jgi:dipeptidyl aminopeptidase/acylaminoacyl peptidase